jgi:ribonuclease P protein component
MPPSTLSARRDIRAVYASRHVVHGGSMSLRGRVRPVEGVETPVGRAAVVASRRIGNAVARNRAKRRLRAVVGAEGVPARVDVIVAAKPPALTAPYTSLLVEYRRLRTRLLRSLEVEAASPAPAVRR